MQLGHSLTRSGFTYPEVSSEVCQIPSASKWKWDQLDAANSDLFVIN
jgi:hypothetical protein